MFYNRIEHQVARGRSASRGRLFRAPEGRRCRGAQSAKRLPSEIPCGRGDRTLARRGREALWGGILALAIGWPAAAGTLNIVATYPDLASIASEVGSDKIKVVSLAHGTEDPHFVDPKPSFILLLNKADLLIQGGMDLEAGWLPPLVHNARNRKILAEGGGQLDASMGVKPLGVPVGSLDRSQGDVHPFGNPHYLLDPANGKLVAANIAGALSRLDAANASFYQQNARRFSERLEDKISEWAGQLRPYRGAKVITYHTSFDYYLHRFGLELAGTIEPKPGIEPSPSHIAGLLENLKESGVKLVMAEPNRPRKTAQYVADSLGAKLILLPILVGGHEDAGDYFSLMTHNVGQTAQALEGSP